ncbi:BTAD domain-containing putative transcriptional regulator [Dactylosporangium sp. CA-092794]|uniref:AfsR/SARP family transcriptional regulator n=1 Tax=Dactylosporangium sp. CA-092794 TaxID=3239929 RepID=UPI003D8DFA94
MLGLLLCRANRTVSVAVLTEALWHDEPPRTAHKNIQVYGSALRKLLVAEDGAGPRLRHNPPGYLIQIGPDQLDALQFAELARAGRIELRRGDAAAGADLLGQAVRLWRGPVLPELSSAQAVADEAEQLGEQYLSTYEDWAETKLALGHHTDLVEELNGLARHHPLRERLRHAQMLALYRSGRQTDALAQFDTMRQLLARELGLRPSPVLARLYEAILTGDPSLHVAALGRLRPASVRATTAERSSLIRDVGDFTGREHEVETLLDMVTRADHRGIAAISGPAGVGKTALAVHCAHRLGERFPDGRILGCLRASDGRARAAADVLGDLLRGIGLTGALPDTEEERAALLRESTAGRVMLLVLDDAVSETQVRSVLAAAGDSVVLVTSRRHLGGLESATHLVLEPLPEAEAVRLLGLLIGPERVAAEPEAARRLAEVCCGLPLAIRIVGAKLAGLRHLTLARYAERLTDERRLLDELVAGDLQLRPRLAVSYQDLTPDDRAALDLLAALTAPTFAVPEIAGSLGTDVSRAEVTIERLIEAHLVEAVEADDVEAHSGGTRYSLSPLIRVFLRERHSGAASRSPASTTLSGEDVGGR